MVIILGLGFTGSRLARRLLQRGIAVTAAVRAVTRFGELAQAGLQLSELTLDQPDAMMLPRNATMAVLIPPLAEPENAGLRTLIRNLAPKRVVYVSSTGVYGDQVEVDFHAQPAPNDERGRRRLEEERWMASGPWESLVLRAAAIYGPGRGVHAAVREGKMPRGVGTGMVSRIHVEDLVSIVEAGLFADLEGAWPVADDEPCSTTEIAEWCAELLQLKPVRYQQPDRLISGRKVDGRKIRELLGVELQYPGWRAGIMASLLEEAPAEEMPQKLTKRLQLK